MQEAKTKVKSSTHPYEVLLVEDSADDVELFLRVLRKVQTDLEIEVNMRVISNGPEAATQVDQRKYDMIFFDFNLPPPNGMDLTKQARQSQFNHSTPVVMITGSVDRGLITRAFQAGANLFLFKPIDRRQLLRLMQVARVTIDRERRRLQRVKVKCRVSIESGKDRLDGETLDVSLNGLFVQADRVLPVGSVVDVNLMLPKSPAPIRTAARIVRIVGTEYMGVQLENIGKAESERLEDFLIPMITSTFLGGK